jgi:uncharacterized protein YndB with AHSA1/START domain
MDIDPATDLSFTRTLAVPKELVWECWTSAEHIPNFFVPRPHKVIRVDIDVRPGGRSNSVFLVDGQEMPQRGVYLEVVPNKRLVFTDAYTEGWKPSPNPFMTAIVDLDDAPGGGTIYTATARHWKPENKEAHEKMGFYDGWGTVATQLEDYAKGLMK